MKSRKKFTGCNRPIRRRVAKHYDWFALVNKYFRDKIMRTSLTITEVWPISDRIIRQKYYCITVHYRTVCTSENFSDKLSKLDSKLSDIWYYFRTIPEGRRQTKSLQFDYRCNFNSLMYFDKLVLQYSEVW